MSAELSWLHDMEAEACAGRDLESVFTSLRGLILAFAEAVVHMDRACIVW